MAKKGTPMKTSESVTVANDDPTAECPASVKHHEDIARVAYSYWQGRGCPSVLRKRTGFALKRSCGN